MLIFFNLRHQSRSLSSKLRLKVLFPRVWILRLNVGTPIQSAHHSESSTAPAAVARYYPDIEKTLKGFVPFALLTVVTQLVLWYIRVSSQNVDS